MKQSPEEKRIRHQFEAGVLTKEGFLGDDIRHVHDIVHQDAAKLAELGVNISDMVDKLRFLINQGKRGLETPVDVGSYEVQTYWYRGMLPCPFGHKGLYPKLKTIVTDKETGKKITYTMMSVHLIEKHGFFGGSGSLYRLDPGHLAAFLQIAPDNDI